MNYKRILSRMTGNYRTLDRKAMAIRHSWNDVEKLISNTGPSKKKKTDGQNKK